VGLKKVDMVILDGLPGAGKSHLLKQLGRRAVDLDDFLPTSKTDGAIPWTTLVTQGGALKAIRRELETGCPLVVGGAAASVVLKPLLDDYSALRAYIKRVTQVNGVTFWDDGYGLAAQAANSLPYFKSIYEFHATEPWTEADLIIERIA
jgi:hypothetical protein